MSRFTQSFEKVHEALDSLSNAFESLQAQIEEYNVEPSSTGASGIQKQILDALDQATKEIKNTPSSKFSGVSSAGEPVLMVIQR